MPRKRKVASVNSNESTESIESTATGKGKRQTSKPKSKQALASLKLSPDQIVAIRVILNTQKSDGNHKKCFAELLKIYKKFTYEKFMEVFMAICFAALHSDEADENGTRILKFIASFVASFGENVTENDDDENQTHQIIRDVFERVFAVYSPVISIRIRICQLIMHIMNSFSAKAEIDDSIYEMVIEGICSDYLKDTSPNVRAQAIYALQRLQDPENNEDPVLIAYTYHMEYDPAPKVRQACLTAIGKRFSVIPIILERLHDSEEKVRRHAFLQMSSYSVKSYKISHRLAFLENGLYDRSESVRKAVVNILLPNWIVAYDYKYVDFVAAIKLDNNDEELQRFRKIAHIALGELFKKQKMKDVISSIQFSDEYRNCVPLNGISLEGLIVWKAVIEHHINYAKHVPTDNDTDDIDEVNKSKDDTFNIDNDLLPELSIFCDFMQKFLEEQNYEDEKWKKRVFNYSVLTLLEILPFYDFGDEIGRNKLQKMLRQMLIDHKVSEDVIKQVVVIFELLIHDPNIRIDYLTAIVCEMVNAKTNMDQSRQMMIDEIIESCDDMTLKLDATKLKLEIMELKEVERNHVEQKQYVEAQKVSERLNVLNEDLLNMFHPIYKSMNNSMNASGNAVSYKSRIFANISALFVQKKLMQSDLVKNMQICYYAIISKGVKTLTLNVMNLYKDFVSRHLDSTDITLRVWTLKIATAYSMLYEGLSKETYMTLKLQLFRNISVPIWEISIECIFELLDRYGLTKLENVTNDDTTVTSNDKSLNAIKSKRSGRTLYTEDIEQDEIMNTIEVMALMAHIMDSNTDMRIYRTVLLGFCRLILHGHYSTREIISKFLLAYFNPATDSEVNQILGVFFQRLIENKQQESLSDALLPTLTTLMGAPYDSPLQEVKIDTIFRYIIESTRPIYCANGLNIHNTMAMQFMQMLMENKSNKELMRVVSNEILTLEISDDPTLKKDLISCIEKLLEEIGNDHKLKKNMETFRSMLNGTYRVPLKFSSTANKLFVPNLSDVDESPAIPNAITEEPENEIVHDNVINREDILDISVSQVKIREVQINIVDVQKTMPKDISETLLSGSKEIDINNMDETEIVIPETQSDFREIPATQQLNDEESLNISSIDSCFIPETQPINSFVELSRQENETDDDGICDSSITIQKTSERSMRSISGQPKSTPIVSPKTRQLKNKRLLSKTPSNAISSPSISSPIAKNPRNSLRSERLQLTSPISNKSRSQVSQAMQTLTQSMSARTRSKSREETMHNKIMTRKSTTDISNLRMTRSSEIASSDNRTKSPTKKIPSAKENSKLQSSLPISMRPRRTNKK